MNKNTLNQTFTDIQTLWDITHDMAVILQDLENQETVQFTGSDKNKDKIHAEIGKVLYRYLELKGEIL